MPFPDTDYNFWARSCRMVERRHGLVDIFINLPPAYLEWTAWKQFRYKYLSTVHLQCSLVKNNLGMRFLAKRNYNLKSVQIRFDTNLHQFEELRVSEKSTCKFRAGKTNLASGCWLVTGLYCNSYITYILYTDTKQTKLLLSFQLVQVPLFAFGCIHCWKKDVCILQLP